MPLIRVIVEMKLTLCLLNVQIIAFVTLMVGVFADTGVRYSPPNPAYNPPAPSYNVPTPAPSVSLENKEKRYN